MKAAEEKWTDARAEFLREIAVKSDQKVALALAEELGVTQSSLRIESIRRFSEAEEIAFQTLKSNLDSPGVIKTLIDAMKLANEQKRLAIGLFTDKTKSSHAITTNVWEGLRELEDRDDLTESEKIRRATDEYHQAINSS